jgi:DNA-binding beta-propeller fold protein YncE
MKKAKAVVKKPKSKGRSAGKKVGKGVKLFLVFFALVFFVVLLYFLIDAVNTAVAAKRTIKNFNVDLEIGSGKSKDVFLEPKDVAVDSANDFYVADFGASAIKKFDENGNLLLSIGTHGSHDNDDKMPGEFNQPSSVWVDDTGNIYIADTFNHRIQEFTAKGKPVRVWTHSFFGPRCVKGDNNGKIFVADTGNHKIQVFDQSGIFLKEFGGHGTGEGKFDEPVGLAVDAKGFVYVADANNNRIQKFDNSGKFVAAFKVSLWHGKNDEVPYLGIHGDSLYASNTSGPAVLRYDLSGKLMAIYKKPDTFPGASGIAVDSIGRVIVTERGVNHVARFTPPEPPSN